MRNCIWPSLHQVSTLLVTRWIGTSKKIAVSFLPEFNNRIKYNIFQNKSKCGWAEQWLFTAKDEYYKRVVFSSREIDADELIVYENAIVYGLQFRKYRSKTDHSHRQSGKNV